METLKALGRKPKLVPGHTLMDGINAVRETLPKCWFDAEKTDYGLDALRQYRSEYKEDDAVFNDKPLHDWTSHAADAFRSSNGLERNESAAIGREANATRFIRPTRWSIQSNMSVRDIIEARKRKREAD